MAYQDQLGHMLHQDYGTREENYSVYPLGICYVQTILSNNRTPAKQA